MYALEIRKSEKITSIQFEPSNKLLEDFTMSYHGELHIQSICRKERLEICSSRIENINHVRLYNSLDRSKEKV